MRYKFTIPGMLFYTTSQLTQRLIQVGPPSTTVAQLRSNVGSLSCVNRVYSPFTKFICLICNVSVDHFIIRLRMDVISNLSLCSQMCVNPLSANNIFYFILTLYGVFQRSHGTCFQPVIIKNDQLPF